MSPCLPNLGRAPVLRRALAGDEYNRLPERTAVPTAGRCPRRGLERAALGFEDVKGSPPGSLDRAIVFGSPGMSKVNHGAANKGLVVAGLPLGLVIYFFIELLSRGIGWVI